MAIRNSLPFAMVPQWLLETSVSDKAVRLYAILARMADKETLRSHPSRKTLGERAHCSIRSIDRALRELEYVGALRLEHRVDVAGDLTSNDYILTPGRDTHDATGSDTDDPTVVSPVSQKRESLERESSEREKTEVVTDAFEAFWAFYPRKIGKGAAKKAFAKALTRASAGTILAGLQRFRSSVVGAEPRFIPHPATWLNADRWLDEEPPAAPAPAPYDPGPPGDPAGFAAAAAERPWKKGDVG